MTEETVCVGVDVAKSILDVAVTDSGEAWQFANDDEGIFDSFMASPMPRNFSISRLSRNNTLVVLEELARYFAK